MRYFLALSVLLVTSTGCANRFGHQNTQTLIDVRTLPPQLTYYVIDQSEAERIVSRTQNGLRVNNMTEFNSLLASQLNGLISNTSPLTYSVGSYMLAVQCPKGFRFQHFDAKDSITNLIQLEC